MAKVYDPADPKLTSRYDFFTSTLHSNALRTLSVPWAVGGSYSISTSVPLPKCDPLTSLKSFTCDQFTAFSLGFRIASVDGRLTKFTDGSTGLTASTNVNGFAMEVHAKSPGFEEFSSGYVRVTKGPMHVSFEAPCIEDQQLVPPIVTVGINQTVAKHVNVIAQLDSRRKAKLGLKFQPCGHMHASVGLAVTDSLTNLHMLETSVYGETHEGVSLGLIGRFVGPRAGMEIIATKKLGKKSNEIVSPEGKVELHQPVIGIMHDVSASKTTAFLDLGIAATTVSTMKFGIKMGLEVVESKFTEPKFCFHITASESSS